LPQCLPESRMQRLSLKFMHMLDNKRTRKHDESKALQKKLHRRERLPIQTIFTERLTIGRMKAYLQYPTRRSSCNRQNKAYNCLKKQLNVFFTCMNDAKLSKKIQNSTENMKYS